MSARSILVSAVRLSLLDPAAAHEVVTAAGRVTIHTFDPLGEAPLGIGGGWTADDADPRRRLVHTFRACSNVVRGKAKARSQAGQAEPLASAPASHPPLPLTSVSPSLAALRRGWAQLIRRVYDVDPLIRPRCRGVMRVVAFITRPRVIRLVLDHLPASVRRATRGRAPPPVARPALARP